MVANSGGLALALLAHFPTHKAASDKTLPEKLRQAVTGDPYAGPFWPLSLELTHLGAGDANWEKADTLPVLRTLHKAKISLVQWNAAPKVFATVDVPDWAPHHPDYAIEDFGTDYGDDGSAQDEAPDGADAISGGLDVPDIPF